MGDPERGEYQIRHDGRSAFFQTAMPLVLIVLKTMPLLRLDPLFFCNQMKKSNQDSPVPISFAFSFQRWLRDGLTLT